jgi:hypothetical protein
MIQWSILTVDGLESLLCVEPDFIRTNANDWPIPLVQCLSQMRHASIANVVCVPKARDGGKLWARDGNQRMKEESVAGDGDEQDEYGEGNCGE